MAVTLPTRSRKAPIREGQGLMIRAVMMTQETRKALATTSPTQVILLISLVLLLWVKISEWNILFC